MAHINHDIDLIRRGALGLLFGIALASFIGLAAASTVYDVGHWIDLW